MTGRHRVPFKSGPAPSPVARSDPGQKTWPVFGFSGRMVSDWFAGPRPRLRPRASRPIQRR